MLCRRRFYIETTADLLSSLLTTTQPPKKKVAAVPAAIKAKIAANTVKELWHWQRHDAENAVKQIREMAEIRSHSKTTTSVEKEIASAAGD
jgi:hypothetical protein